VTVPWVIAGVLAALWLLVALFQLGDVATVFVDSRTARDRDAPGRLARERINELFWIIPVVAILALAIGVGIDYAGRNFFDTGQPAIGSLLLLGVAVLVVGVSGLALGAVAATDSVSYAMLRRDLREAEGTRITPAQLLEFRARLSRVDARTRSKTRQTRILVTPTSVVRLVAIAVGILLVIAVCIAVALSQPAERPWNRGGSLIVISVLAPVLSAVFAALGIRFGLSSDTAWRRVYARQRLDILKLLEGFDRVTRKGVAGLGDRVARALKILGEQQQQQ
jgi:hypothetical protein